MSGIVVEDLTSLASDALSWRDLVQFIEKALPSGEYHDENDNNINETTNNDVTSKILALRRDLFDDNNNNKSPEENTSTDAGLLDCVLHHYGLLGHLYARLSEILYNINPAAISQEYIAFIHQKDDPNQQLRHAVVIVRMVTGIAREFESIFQSFVSDWAALFFMIKQPLPTTTTTSTPTKSRKRPYDDEWCIHDVTNDHVRFKTNPAPEPVVVLDCDSHQPAESPREKGTHSDDDNAAVPQVGTAKTFTKDL